MLSVISYYLQYLSTSNGSGSKRSTMILLAFIAGLVHADCDLSSLSVTCQSSLIQFEIECPGEYDSDKVFEGLFKYGK